MTRPSRVLMWFLPIITQGANPLKVVPLPPRACSPLIHAAHGFLRKALADAVDKGLLRHNAADKASPPKTSATRAPEHAVWTPEQLRHFLASVRDHHHYALWHLAAFTGLRRGELCGLKWSDVDLDGRSLVVRHTLTSVEHRPV